VDVHGGWVSAAAVGATGTPVLAIADGVRGVICWVLPAPRRLPTEEPR
jgi:hypothetical protein